MQALVVVKSVILNHKLKKALLIRRSPEDEEGGFWESAGGNVEEGETLEGGIIREVFEETGLNVVPEKFLYASLDEIGGKKMIFIVYLCSTSEEVAVLSKEHTDYRWVDKAECKELLCGGIAEDYIKHGVYEIEW
ncbi:MAG: NUDIX domain-containing protein [Ruminococcaceae bacterium]|nr:NUDIX domain-containing protein [Oscillospiraceae bacterium]